MISNILVATDGSETADRAVEFATDLALRLDVPMTIGHVLQHSARIEELGRMTEVEHLVQQVKSDSKLHLGDIPSNIDAVFSGPLSRADRERIITVIGEKIVDGAARRAKDAGAKSVSTRVNNGDYDEGILKMASEIGADTIVIGRRGLGRVQRIFQGSVSQKVNHRADCTVITVR